MTAQRVIDGYTRRLAKITASESSSLRLTAECIGAVIAYWVPAEPPYVLATLTGFTYRQGVGLFGPRIALDVTVCDACVFQRGACDRVPDRTLADLTVVGIWRNADDGKRACETELAT